MKYLWYEIFALQKRNKINPSFCVGKISLLQQFHSLKSEFHKSARIYFIVAIPYGKSDKSALFVLFVFVRVAKEDTEEIVVFFKTRSAGI